jgi:Cu2+-exporting ATPase
MDFEVRHSMLGRLRLRLPALGRTEKAIVGCLSAVSREKGVIDVRWNKACASLIIRYEPGRRETARSIVAIICRASTNEWRKRGAECALAPAANGSGMTMGWLTRLEPEEHALGRPAVSLVLAMWGGPFSWLNLPLLVYNALPSWRSALRVLRKEHRLNVDFLDGLAILIALAQANFLTTAVMIMLIALGNWIREHTAGRSKRAISELLDYQGRNAWVVRGAKVARVPVKSLRAGDDVLVYTGELIPVDGKVLRGSAIVDQKTITGESLPVTRSVNDSVYAATAVREGKLVVHALRVGADTAAAQIVRMVETAPIGETRIQNYAEKFADRLVAPQLALGCGLFCVTGNVNRFLSMTIIDYGTGMRVAAPTAVLASMIHAARQGIVIRSGSHVEKLANIDTVVFDKTGTLTTGSPEVLDVISYSVRHFPEQRILGLAAAAEARLEHPVARAVVMKAREQHVEVPGRSGSRYEIGMGVSARINGFFVHVGSERFLLGKGICLDQARRDLHHVSERGCSPLLVAVDDALVGLIPYADHVRPESAAVIQALYRRRRVRRAVMLTGDNTKVARAVAGQLGLREFVANTMPADKADIIRQFQKEGSVVAMVGDGINDSPALAYADIGIAMKNGADVAQESADVVLMEDNLWKVVQAIDISKNSMRLIRQNYAFIAGLNTLALLFALPAGLVSPNTTALISNGSAILAALNAIRPILRY